MIKKFKSDKQLFKMILTIAIPIAFQNLLSSLTQMMDSVMLGELGNLQLDASSLANQIFFIFALFIFGSSGGASILTAQYWGKKDLQPIKIVMATMLRIVFVVSLVLTLFVAIFPHLVMSLFTSDQNVIDAGVEYLSIVAFTYILFGISNTLTMLFRSIELVKLSVIANATTLVLNVGLNYILIFGNFGAPRLELKGAAYATLIARFVELLVVLFYVFFKEKRLHFTFKCFFLSSKSLNRDLRKYCTPVVLNELAWSIGITLQAALFGHMSSMETVLHGAEAATAVSANTIIGVVQNLATLVIFGVANAAGVIIGKTIGEGNIDLAKQRGRVIQILSVMLGVVGAIAVLLLRDVMVDFYNVNEATKLLAKDMLYITSIVIFFVSMTGISIVGILRGGGDARFSLFIELVSLWGFSVPLGYLAGLVFGLPVLVVYALFKSDEVVKAIFCLVRLKGTKWISVVTRDQVEVKQKA